MNRFLPTSRSAAPSLLARASPPPPAAASLPRRPAARRLSDTAPPARDGGGAGRVGSVKYFDPVNLYGFIRPDVDSRQDAYVERVYVHNNDVEKEHPRAQ